MSFVRNKVQFQLWPSLLEVPRCSRLKESAEPIHICQVDSKRLTGQMMSTLPRTTIQGKCRLRSQLLLCIPKNTKSTSHPIDGLLLDLLSLPPRASAWECKVSLQDTMGQVPIVVIQPREISGVELSSQRHSSLVPASGRLQPDLAVRALETAGVGRMGVGLFSGGICPS